MLFWERQTDDETFLTLATDALDDTPAVAALDSDFVFPVSRLLISS